MKAYENRAVFTGRVVSAELNGLVAEELEARVEAEELRMAEMDRYYDDDDYYNPNRWDGTDKGFRWVYRLPSREVPGIVRMRRVLLAGLAEKTGPVLGRIAA